MTPEEKNQYLQDLQQSKEALLHALQDISPEQFTHKVSPDKWSVAEIVEHLVKVESAILDSLQRLVAKEKKRVPETVLSYEEVMTQAKNSEAKAQSPERLVPSGRFLEKTAAIQAFEQTRENTEAFVRTTTYDLGSISFPHPRLGVLTGKNWLTFISGHCWRHAAQVEKLRS